ncbi:MULTISPECIES: DUF6711 family protein [Clostridium]|uniref:DUF6711 family protein n=1 Tax=Clostridium TaxID=1485 RepID=UPI0020675FBE|nr:DUF6711 family protein [Clostridium sp.]MDU1032544.1 DUF6711 family protein [Clostridium sp.]DAJ63226.1 MAG TPA: hypothetical protein [Caudoviricetes sp.]DAL55881.1 MAG TPA_asm: hypothetical protein [Bacteriophage sp.]
MIRINNVKMPSPTSYSVTISDISSDDSKRNARGDMLIDRIATKRKIEMSWDFISLEDMSLTLKLVKDIFFDVEYPDPEEGKFMTRTFYVGDRTVPMLDIINGKPMWKNVKFNLIER